MHRSKTASELLAAWRDALAEWAIPEEIVARAPEPPWFFPTNAFSRRAERQIEARVGASLQRAREVLDGGTVIDVGAGGGAASLPLAGGASLIIAVDSEQAMLEDFSRRAARLGVRAETVLGPWPDVAGAVPAADVVLCHHVLYNVALLEPFVSALTDHARRRVVVELTERHPQSNLNPLWLEFHGLVRPERPTAGDAVAALRALGLDVQEERWEVPAEPYHSSFQEMVTETRRRLCLPAEREPDVAVALEGLGVDPRSPGGLGAPRRLVTLWWRGGARTGDGPA